MREETDYLGQSNIKSTSLEGKLSTILASDVVGFSKMMASKEESTLEILRKRRQVIDGVIAEHAGTIFGSAGDSMIASTGITAHHLLQSELSRFRKDYPELEHRLSMGLAKEPSKRLRIANRVITEHKS
jgi:class 3 adenylate cyclase